MQSPVVSPASRNAGGGGAGCSRQARGRSRDTSCPRVSNMIRHRPSGDAERGTASTRALCFIRGGNAEPTARLAPPLAGGLREVRGGPTEERAFPADPGEKRAGLAVLEGSAREAHGAERRAGAGEPRCLAGAAARRGEAARGAGRGAKGGGVPASKPWREHRLQFCLARRQAQSRRRGADLAAGVRRFLTAGRDEPPQGYCLGLRPQRVTLGPAQLGKIP